jgi:glutathione S-transferase
MQRVWGRASSVNVMKIVWLLELLRQPYERIDAGRSFGVTDSADYRAMNPNGKIPTLQQDDGFVLWESNPILRYLASTCPGGEAYWPADPRRRANVDRWMDWQQTTIDAPMRVLLRGLVRTPPAERNMAEIEAAVADAGLAWSQLNDELSRHAFVAGENFTLADIVLAVHVHRWFAFDIERPDLPALRAWYDGLLTSPIYRQHGALPL